MQEHSVHALHLIKPLFICYVSDIQECLHQPEIKLESLKEDVRKFLKTSGGHFFFLASLTNCKALWLFQNN